MLLFVFVKIAKARSSSVKQAGVPGQCPPESRGANLLVFPEQIRLAMGIQHGNVRILGPAFSLGPAQSIVDQAILQRMSNSFTVDPQFNGSPLAVEQCPPNCQAPNPMGIGPQWRGRQISISKTAGIILRLFDPPASLVVWITCPQQPFARQARIPKPGSQLQSSGSKAIFARKDKGIIFQDQLPISPSSGKCTCPLGTLRIDIPSQGIANAVAVLAPGPQCMRRMPRQRLHWSKPQRQSRRQLAFESLGGRTEASDIVIQPPLCIPSPMILVGKSSAKCSDAIHSRSHLATQSSLYAPL